MTMDNTPLANDWLALGGRVCAVTGAGSGIGSAIARGLAEAGAKVALIDLDPNTPEGKEILSLNRATRYIPTKAENYTGVEAAARSAGLL